jgi:hypothetical protein
MSLEQDSEVGYRYLLEIQGAVHKWLRRVGLLSIHKGDVGNGESLLMETQVDVKHDEDGEGTNVQSPQRFGLSRMSK